MKHLFFDLDGTLTDSAPGITRCLRHAVEAVGGSAPDELALRDFIGTPLVEIFAALLGSPDREAIDVAIRHYTERFDRVGIFENSMFPGVSDALAALRDEGFTLYVATAKTPDTALRVVRHFALEPTFAAVYGIERDEQAKDKGTLLRRALDSEGLEAHEAAMIGDRHHDVRGARDAGVHSVGVAWGYGAQAELDEADRVASTPSELVALFAGGGG